MKKTNALNLLVLAIFLTGSAGTATHGADKKDPGSSDPKQLRDPKRPCEKRCIIARYAPFTADGKHSPLEECVPQEMCESSRPKAIVKARSG